MASKIFFSHQKVYFWISAFDHRAIVLDKMHIVQWRLLYLAFSIQPASLGEPPLNAHLCACKRDGKYVSNNLN